MDDTSGSDGKNCRLDTAPVLHAATRQLSPVDTARLHCLDCGELTSVAAWLAAAQVCPKCGGHMLEAVYPKLAERLPSLLGGDTRHGKGLWRYLDLLPVNDARAIVSFGEGDAPLERWRFLEEIAAEFGID